MSPDKADTEVPAGGEHGLRKRLALISASVLLITAGAFAYHHSAAEGETSLGASGAGLRLPQGRRLPHYTTYGGTSYDFMGESQSPPAGCCCVKMEDFEKGKDTDLQENLQCTMKFKAELEYNPTMPPLGAYPRLGYNPTMPPGYNPTRPPAEWPIPVWKAISKEEGQCCCSNELKTGGKGGYCEAAFLSYNPTRPPGDYKP
jgi:hypothetical protein